MKYFFLLLFMKNPLEISSIILVWGNSQDLYLRFLTNVLSLKIAFFKTQVDGYTHLYTLIIRPDQTYKVKIDNEMVASGNLEDDLDFLPPKKINDPTVKKPMDWDDRIEIDDPNDVKPEVICSPYSALLDDFISTACMFDIVELHTSFAFLIFLKDWDEPEYLMDMSAEKPADWDDAVNGEWHYPRVKNPLYRV